MMTSRELGLEKSKGGGLDRRPGRRRGVLAAWALLWLLQTVAAPAAQAQRRRGEPEANPEFQEQLQGQPGAQAGQPFDAGQGAPGGAGGGYGGAGGGYGAPGGGGGYGDPRAGEPTADPGGYVPRAGVQGVQLGAAAAAPAPPAPPTSPLETRVTVRVKDAPLATFLDTISAQAKVNFLISGEQVNQRRVTAFLQNVTVREALQILLEIKGLTYQQIGRSNTYVVSPRSQSAPNQITRIYTLSHVPLIPILSSADSGEKEAEKEAVTQGTTEIVQGAVRPGQQGAGSGGGGNNKAPGPIAIINVINSLLSQNGRVSVDPRSNSLIVTDIPEVFPQVEQIIAELDKKVPQVMIEAQIVEINSERAQQLGLEWGDAQGTLAGFAGGTRQTSFPLNLPTNLANTHFFEGNGSIQNSVVDLTKLTVVLRALVTRAEARFLGKPKILTLNNKKAKIEITRDQATDLGQSTGGAGGVNQTTSVTVNRKETGLVLEVTPQVNKEGYVTLLVQPTYTEVVESRLNSLQNPVLDPIKRTASTLLRLKNGQTVVMGGLLSSSERRTKRKVPILGYIPLIGWLFTSVSTTRQNTDLVIFLTPTVVSD